MPTSNERKMLSSNEALKELNEVKWHCHDMKMGQPVSRTKTRIGIAEINILKDNPENVQTW